MNPEDARKAVEALSKSGVSIDGSHINVSMARPKGHPDSKSGRIGRTLYVGNLDYNIEDWQVEEYFNQLGEVDRVTLPKSPEGRGRGFAFVMYKTLEGAS